MIRIAFYVSGRAGRIRRLLELGSEVIFDSTIFVVCDNLFNRDIENQLQSRECKLIDFDYHSLAKTNSERNRILSDKILDNMMLHKVDYLFCFGEHILKGPLLSIFHNKIINFHPSILPSFPGLNAIDQALSSSVQVLGNTAHFIDSGIDTGPIIMQSVITRRNVSNYEVVLNLQIPMMYKILDLLNKDKIKIIDNKVIIDIENTIEQEGAFFTI